MICSYLGSMPFMFHRHLSCTCVFIQCSRHIFMEDFFFLPLDPLTWVSLVQKLCVTAIVRRQLRDYKNWVVTFFFPSFTFPLLGPDGAAVATSELDPLPPSDLSTAIALLPLSPSVHHPLISVCRSVYPWTGCDSGGRGTATQRVKTK